VTGNNFLAREMSLLIDGHNLIGKLPGFRLSDENDEMRLVELLQVYCRVKQRNVTVFFDNAAPGYGGQKRYGRVTAVFVLRGRPADDAIIARLRQAGRKARNLTVVSSDGRILAQARSSQAKGVASEVFADELLDAQRTALEAPSAGQAAVNPAEVVEWLRIFGEAGKKKKT
jgi:predicted RNA-binding protein with PIN domain